MRNRPALPETDFAEQLAAIEARLARWRGLLDKVESRRAAIRAELAELTVDETLLLQGPNGAALIEGDESLCGLNQRAESLRNHVRRLHDQSDAVGRVRTSDLHALGPLVDALCDDLQGMCDRWRRYEAQALRRDALAAQDKKLRRLHERLSRQIRALLVRQHDVIRRRDHDQPPAYDHQREARLAADIQRLNANHGTLLGQIQACERELREVRLRLDEPQREFKPQDAALADKRLELALTRRQLAERAERWRASAVASHVLQVAGEARLARRQTRLLRKAQEYFAQLSDGAYTRVWIPLNELALRVDDKTGHTLTPRRLPPASRRQLYLSLRLAEIRSYARRGCACPCCWMNR